MNVDACANLNITLNASQNVSQDHIPGKSIATRDNHSNGKDKNREIKITTDR